VARLHPFKRAQEKFFNLHRDQCGAFRAQKHLFEFLKRPRLVDQIEVLFHETFLLDLD
jgi:hypothetical protein